MTIKPGITEGGEGLFSATPNNAQAGQRPVGWNLMEPKNLPVLAAVDEEGRPTGQLTAPDGQVVGGGVLEEILSRYSAARGNNSYGNAQIALAAEGATPTAGQLGYSVAAEGTIANYTTLNFNAAYPTTTYPVSTGDIRPFRAHAGFMDRNGGNAAHVYSHFRRDQTTRERGSSRIVVGVASSRLVFTCVGTRILRLVIDDGSGPRRVPDIVVSGSGNRDVTLNFDEIGGNIPRTVHVLLGGTDTTSLRAAKWPNSATLWTPEERLPQILLLTDSLGNTVPGSTAAAGAFPDVMGAYLGCEVYTMPEGSTGYSTRGDSPTTKTTFAERFDTAALMGSVLRPSVVCMAGGVNDNNDDALNAGVDAAITASRRVFPGVPVVIFGPWAPNNTANQGLNRLKEDRIKAVADAMGATFIPVMRAVPAYISGSGNTSAPANNGNADVLFGSTDGAHWIEQGHRIIGARAADDFARAVRRLLGR